MRDRQNIPIRGEITKFKGICSKQLPNSWSEEGGRSTKEDAGILYETIHYPISAE